MFAPFRAALVVVVAVATIAAVGAAVAADGLLDHVRPTVPFTAAAADADALTALMRYYDPDTGRMVGWWQSANALDAMLDADQALGRPVPRALLVHVWTVNYRRVGPDFVGDYVDDAAWWAALWLHAYRLTGDHRYLTTARTLDDFMAQHWTPTCGGGVTWAISLVTNYSQKNTITNALYVLVSAELGALTRSSVFTARATRGWYWLAHSGLIRTDGLMADHLVAGCQPFGSVWTYNQGATYGALNWLTTATGNRAYLREAARLADHATTSALLNPGGVATDPCERPGTCGYDGGVFKGAYVRYLGQLSQRLGRRYHHYLAVLGGSLYHQDQTTAFRYGLSWTGRSATVNAYTQASAVDLLTALATN